MGVDKHMDIYGDFLMDQQSKPKEKINPFIEVQKGDKPPATWVYVDEWVPEKEDIIFTSVIGAFIAPVYKYYKYPEPNISTDYFVTSTKKCYNSDLMRAHMCQYLNYFEKYYDAEKEYFMIVDSESITDGDYEIVYTSSSPQMIEINNVSEDFDTSLNPIYSGEVGTVAEYLNIIPGITFILNEVDENVNVGDTVGIHVQAPTRGDAIAEDDVYYISYKYKKAEEDYDPILYYNYDDVIQAYGNYDVTASGVVINSLTLAAELAFRAGVNPIVCVQAKNDSKAYLEDSNYDDDELKKRLVASIESN